MICIIVKAESEQKQFHERNVNKICVIHDDY